MHIVSSSGPAYLLRIGESCAIGWGLDGTIIKVNAWRSMILTTGLPPTIPLWLTLFGEEQKPNPEIKGHPTLDPVDVSISH